MPRVWEPACCSTEVWGSTVPLAASPGSTARTINVKACGLGSARITPSTYLNYYIYIYITILYIYIYVYNYTIYIWVRLEIPYPLEGLSRGYASEVCFGVCFGVCFAWTSSHGTYFISKRPPTNFPTFYISLCISLHAYIYIETHMVFWSKSTAKGQSLAFPSTGEARG